MILTQHGNNSRRLPTCIIGGRQYKVVKIDDQFWMAENLDFKFPGCTIGQAGSPSSPAAWYYSDDEATYGIDGTRKCGLLYNWHAADYLEQNKAILCPGWHVPTTSEWDTLATAVGGTSTAGTKLKASGVSWAGTWGGTDDYGFAALPTGVRYNGSFYSVGSSGFFWTATASLGNEAWSRYFDTSAQMKSNDNNKTTFAFSVRLVRD